jgi:hypothetical protein
MIGGCAMIGGCIAGIGKFIGTIGGIGGIPPG